MSKLTQEECDMVERFATSRREFPESAGLRVAAEAIYTKYCTPENYLAAHGTHMNFMSEVMSPSPDLMLRSMLRGQLRDLAAKRQRD